MFYSFFNSLARSRYLSFFSHSFSYILWSAGTAKSTILQVLFFFINYYYYYYLNFAVCSFFPTSSLVLHWRPRARESRDFRHSVYLYFLLTFFSFTLIVHSRDFRRRAVLQNAMFCINIQAGTARYLVSVFISVFLNHTQSPIITVTMVVLRCHISHSLSLTWILSNIQFVLKLIGNK